MPLAPGWYWWRWPEEREYRIGQVVDDGGMLLLLHGVHRYDVARNAIEWGGEVVR